MFTPPKEHGDAPAEFDDAKFKKMQQKVVDAASQTAMMFGSVIGHRLGLFDAMAALCHDIDSVASNAAAPLTPAARNVQVTCQEIAQKAGMNERYVKEWLAAMVCSRVVEYNRETDKYFLPIEHVMIFCRKAGFRNMPGRMQTLPLVWETHAKVEECFRNGGGVSYEHFQNFHSTMADVSDQRNEALLLSHFIPLAPGLPETLEKGAKVLDVGCGSGTVSRLLGAAYPKSQFYGYDFGAEAIAKANQRVQEAKLPNVQYQEVDVSKLSEMVDLHGTFDVITAFDAIHDQSFPDKVVQGIFQLLKPGGLFYMVDINARANVADNLNHPLATFGYTVSYLHCMTVSLSEPGGAGLGTMWGVETAEKMLRETGFVNFKMVPVPGDILNALYTATKPVVSRI